MHIRMKRLHFEIRKSTSFNTWFVYSILFPQGSTPLHCASNDNVASVLITNGADINIKNLKVSVHLGISSKDAFAIIIQYNFFL